MSWCQKLHKHVVLRFCWRVEWISESQDGSHGPLRGHGDCSTQLCLSAVWLQDALHFDQALKLRGFHKSPSSTSWYAYKTKTRRHIALLLSLDMGFEANSCVILKERSGSRHWQDRKVGCPGSLDSVAPGSFWDSPVVGHLKHVFLLPEHLHPTLPKPFRTSCDAFYFGKPKNSPAEVQQPHIRKCWRCTCHAVLELRLVFDQKFPWLSQFAELQTAANTSWAAFRCCPSAWLRWTQNAGISSLVVFLLHLQ